MSQNQITGRPRPLPVPSRKPRSGVGALSVDVEFLKEEVAKIPAGLRSGVKLPHIEKAKGTLADDTLNKEEP